MENKNTSLKVLVGILLILVIAMGGFIFYREVLDKKEEPKKEEKVVEEKNSIETEVKDNNNEKTSDERYKEYLANAKNNLKKNFKVLPDDYENKTLKDDEYMSFIESANLGKHVYAYLDENGLELEYDGNTIKEIKNAIYIKMIQSMTAPQFDLYYITDSGEVYDISGTIVDNKVASLDTQKISGVKNIVRVESVGYGIYSGDTVAYFIDIDGNGYLGV